MSEPHVTLPHRYRNAGRARRQFGALADRFGIALLRGDPLADAVVQELSPMARTRRMALVDQAVERGIQKTTPPSLRTLLAVVEQEPTWLDWDRLRRGALAYQRLGLAKIPILISISLMRGYHSSAVNKPLTFTARLDAMARKRLGTTGQYLHDVAQVGGMRRWGRGFKETIKVRLLHAHIRHMLLQSPKWRCQDWGTPLNQADLCTTGLAFSYAVLLGARQMGFRFSTDEAEDILHLWRYVSALMGVEDALQWATEADARRLSDLIDMTQPGADEWSRKLAQALRAVPVEVASSRPTIPSWLGPAWQHYLDGLTRAFNGDPIADDLGIPRTRWTASLAVTRAIVGAVERVRARVPGATWAMTVTGNRLFARAVAETLGDDRTPTTPPSRLPGEHRVASSWLPPGDLSAAKRREGTLRDLLR